MTHRMNIAGRENKPIQVKQAQDKFISFLANLALTKKTSCIWYTLNDSDSSTSWTNSQRCKFALCIF